MDSFLAKSTPPFGMGTAHGLAHLGCRFASRRAVNEGNDGLRTVALTVLSADNRMSVSRVGKLIALGRYDKADRLWDAAP